MITAKLEPELAALAARLTSKAKALAEAQVQNDRLSQTRSARRWCKAALLWPLFTKG
jgi:hypothetical protein